VSLEPNSLIVEQAGRAARRLGSWGLALIAAAPMGVVPIATLAALGALGCREGRATVSSETGAVTPASAVANGTAAGLGTVSTVTASLRPSGAPSALGADAGVPPLVRVSELEAATPPDACPATMAYVPGGEFWMGSVRGRGEYDERPRYLTKVANYCLDTYEVTTASYTQCVAHGQCSEPRGTHGTCNYGKREDHPINCVDWNQAEAYCQSQGSRLPTELEWEYAARGGRKYFQFSWGSDSPEDHACWKSRQTCPVGSYAAGAFGLRDVSGNVWEWTHDWFGSYPWPERSGRQKVFRGGGYNRRSDRWFSTTLRNRAYPAAWSAQLGFRCARLAKDSECPFGPGDEPGTCRHGVLDVECSGRAQSFNGQRCASPGAPLCRASEDLIVGFGCVRRDGAAADEDDPGESRETRPDDGELEPSEAKPGEAKPGMGETRPGARAAHRNAAEDAPAVGE
jgi:formylglycine-generating enzyme required for sulfatase activity